MLLLLDEQVAPGVDHGLECDLAIDRPAQAHPSARKKFKLTKRERTADAASTRVKAVRLLESGLERINRTVKPQINRGLDIGLDRSRLVRCRDERLELSPLVKFCLLYTSDAGDEAPHV
jgi:hypothetical protein